MMDNKYSFQNIFKLLKGLVRVVIFFLFVQAFSFTTTENIWANNLQVSEFEVYDTNSTTNTITFQCDVTWDNSWRTTTNYDVVWVFLKYSIDGGMTWNHASMSANGVNPIGFNAPTSFEIIVPSDEKGFFLQRTDLSSGSVTASGVRFAWDYGQDGLDDGTAMAANTVNKIFSVEMVYIPQGAFYLGDGNSSSDYRFKQGSADNDPWYVQSETALTTTNSTNDGFYYTSTGATSESATGSVFIVPSSFPKGYQATYIMKYELTEGQWVSFFNTLTSAQRTTRDITSITEGGKNSDAVIDRNTISWDSTDSFSDAFTSRSDRPVSYVSWPDVLAYADWAGLRPITELEYEKVARGKDITAIANEYAWAQASYNDAQATEIFPDVDEDGTEEIFDGAANVNRNTLGWSSGDGRVGGLAAGQKGPLRAGIFAESSTTRATAGAGFYGAMELSGNLQEMVVSIGRAEGRQFLGTHGDGELSTVTSFEGNATNIDWPGINSIDSARGITGTAGSGYRGGDFSSSALKHLQISNRTNAAKDPDTHNYSQRYDGSLGVYAGGRLGRTAP